MKINIHTEKKVLNICTALTRTEAAPTTTLTTTTKSTATTKSTKLILPTEFVCLSRYRK
jgi:hypothetical protein